MKKKRVYSALKSPRHNKNPLPNGIICEDIKIKHRKTCLGHGVVE